MASSISSYDSIGDSRDVPRKIFHRRALLTPDRSDPIPAKSLDISRAGMSVIIDRPLAEGQKCTVQINLILDDEPGQVSFGCSVIYSVLVGTQGFRIGLQFVALDAHAEEVIKKIMQTR